ncbi:MAG: transglutaminase family protein, partial [Pirellulaceae bacterium]
TKDGMIEMTGRDHVPQLTVVHLRSPGLNLSPLRRGVAARRPRAVAIELEPYRQLPATRWQPLAAAWTAGVPGGWLQIEAIVDRLQSDFEFDPMARVPDDAPDAVAHFLPVRRGPDYLFATTAVMLLRSLGHPARLVTGFYARSDRFDHRARQTTVLGEDVHVWAEVCVDGRNWVTIEPTPGYAPPHEERAWTEWATEECRKLVRWSAGHVAELLSCTVGIGLLVVLRRVCLDAVGGAICWLCGCRGTRARLVWTIRLLEWRAWLTNRTRPPERTVATWYGPLRQAATPETRPLLESFFRWSDRLLYSPHAIPLSHQSEIQQSCRAIAAVAKRSRLQSCLSSPSSDLT